GLSVDRDRRGDGAAGRDQAVVLGVLVDDVHLDRRRAARRVHGGRLRAAGGLRVGGLRDLTGGTTAERDGAGDGCGEEGRAGAGGCTGRGTTSRADHGGVVLPAW